MQHIPKRNAEDELGYGIHMALTLDYMIKYLFYETNTIVLIMGSYSL